MYNKEKIGKGLIEDKMMGLYVINTSGGRTDLVMIFKTKSQLDIGKLAMWRLKFRDATWLSDYVVNYRDQHLESVEENKINLDQLSVMALEDPSTATNPGKMTVDDMKILYEHSISGKLF